jgi:hypothetical protein
LIPDRHLRFSCADVCVAVMAMYVSWPGRMRKLSREMMGNWNERHGDQESITIF